MNQTASAVQTILSIDVEDWFHILELSHAPDLSQWEALPSRVERNFHHLMDLLARHGVNATCFFLGWVAERFPNLVREAAARGHEVASHGYSHTLCHTMTPQAFLEDVRKARQITENALAAPVCGYRAPGFSVTDTNPWFFEKLAQAGFLYDSSVFPTPRAHGGMRGGRLDPYEIDTPYGKLVELPVSVASVIGKPMCFFGGGYLRLFPYPLIRTMARRVLAEGRPLIIYVHPREIDPDHPRLSMSRVRRFKSYVNLATTEPKLSRIMEEFRPITFRQYLSETGRLSVSPRGSSASELERASAK